MTGPVTVTTTADDVVRLSTRITPVILSGGSGTRLWPVSTPAQPKQFLALAGDHSMFRMTLDRVQDRTLFAAPIIVCGADHVRHVEADLAGAAIDDAIIIVEPAQRNTAPAIALAAHVAAKNVRAANYNAAGGDEPDGRGVPILVMPSDHVMTDVAAFHAAIAAALPVVQSGALATFGITPSGPETGYGYIAMGPPRADFAGICDVDRFVEKPDRAAAEAMLAAGGNLWNAGIFLMRADVYLHQLALHAGDIATRVAAAMESATRERGHIHPDAVHFMASPSNSIDYAVMEHAANVVVAPVDPGWSDVGGWAALYDLGQSDDDGNVAAGAGSAITLDSRGNYTRGPAGVRIALLGVDNLVVVATGTDILVMPRNRAQDVKAIVDRV